MKQETPEEFFGLADNKKGSEIYVAGKSNMKKAIGMAHKLGGTHIVRFEVVDMWSRQLGECKSVIIGPTCTIKDLEAAGKGKVDTELVSMTKWPVAYMEVPEPTEATGRGTKRGIKGAYGLKD